MLKTVRAEQVEEHDDDEYDADPEEVLKEDLAVLEAVHHPCQGMPSDVRRGTHGRLDGTVTRALLLPRHASAVRPTCYRVPWPFVCYTTCTQLAMLTVFVRKKNA